MTYVTAMLSTALGHSDPASTYWYLEAHPSSSLSSHSASKNSSVNCHEPPRSQPATGSYVRFRGKEARRPAQEAEPTTYRDSLNPAQIGRGIAHLQNRAAFDQQRLVETGDCVVAAAGGDLYQRGRMRHPGTERDPAKPLPGYQIGHFPLQRRIAQSIPELQKYQPQIGSIGIGERPIRASKYATKGTKNTGSSSGASTRPNSTGSTKQFRRQDRVPHRRPVVDRTTRHNGLESFSPRILGHCPSSKPLETCSRGRLFQVEVAA